MTSRKTKLLAFDAMLSAMYVALSMVSINLPNMKISPDSLPILVAAMLLGPAHGLTVGLLGSFISQLITYGLTVTTPLWIIPAGVRGLVVGLYAKKHGYDLSREQSIFITVLSAMIVTALNTLVMYIDSVIFMYYSYAYVFGAMVPRIIAGVLTAVVFAVLLPGLVERIRKKMSIEPK